MISGATVFLPGGSESFSGEKHLSKGQPRRRHRSLLQILERLGPIYGANRATAPNPLYRLKEIRTGKGERPELGSKSPPDALTAMRQLVSPYQGAWSRISPRYYLIPEFGTMLISTFSREGASDTATK
jgi:hypothetical protein